MKEQQQLPSDNRSEEQLRQDLEQTRERVSSDVEALGQKLSPANLKAEAKHAIQQRVHDGAEQARHGLESAGNRVVNTVRSNPIPFALIGAGVGWLWWNARHSSNGDGQRSSGARDHRYWDRFEQLGDRVRDGVGAFEREARQRARDTGEAVERWEGRIQREAAQVSNGARDTLQENPLLLGAIAAGAGITVGLLVPATESENQLVGRYRDQLLSGAKSKLQRVEESAKSSARRVAQQVSESAQSELREFAPSLSSGE